MKTWLLFFTFLITFLVFAQAKDAQGLDFNSAVKFLAANKSKVNGALLEGIQWVRISEDEAAKRKLFNESMDAIEVIHISHKEVELSTLIPFLGVTEDAGLGYTMGSSFLAPAASVMALRRRDTWPAYAVILDMPNAAADLEKFSLDKHNALDGRLEAFQILAELDQVRAKNIAGLLESEIAGNPSLKDRESALGFLKDVKAGNFYFHGPFAWQNMIRDANTRAVEYFQQK